MSNRGDVSEPPRTTRDASPRKGKSLYATRYTTAVKTIFQMLDLFGDVQVTTDDLHAWVSAISPAWALSERSLTYYIRHWDVAGKVRHAKLAGTFDAIIENARSRRASLLRRFGISGSPHD
jgi:hypothetical protein